MNVAELIKRLQQFPGNFEIIEIFEGCLRMPDAEAIHITTKEDTNLFLVPCGEDKYTVRSVCLSIQY